MEMKYTKNKFKKEIKNMDQVKLINKLGEVNLKIMKGRFKMARKENPYIKGEYPMKLIKWMKCVITQELHMRTI